MNMYFFIGSSVVSVASPAPDEAASVVGLADASEALAEAVGGGGAVSVGVGVGVGVGAGAAVALAEELAPAPPFFGSFFGAVEPFCASAWLAKNGAPANATSSTSPNFAPFFIPAPLGSERHAYVPTIGAHAPRSA